MRKRSKYRPKPQLPDPLTWVISGMRPVLTATEVMDNVRIKNHLALRCVVEGTATRRDMDVLIEAFNVTEALLTMCRRGVAKGERFVFTGVELNRCTVAQMEKALHEVIKDIANKKARLIV